MRIRVWVHAVITTDFELLFREFDPVSALGGSRA